MKTAHLHVLGLALLTLATFGLRLGGIGFGLPLKVEIDCKIPYQVEALREDVENPVAERHFNFYPLLLARLILLWPESEAAPLDAPLEDHLEAAARPFVRARITVALIAALIVPLTWLLARLFLPAGGAYLAAALAATSVLHISFSQQARPHAPASALFLAAVLAAVWVRRRDDWPRHLVLGTACMLALGCLQSGVLVLPAAVLAYMLRSGGPRRILDGRVAIPLVLAALAVPLFYPFFMAGDVGQEEEVLQLSGHLIFLDLFNGRGFRVFPETLWSYEPTLLVLVVLAGLLWILGRRRGATAVSGGWGDRRDAWIAWSFVLPYFLVFGAYERTYERFVLPLLPYLAGAGAWAVWRIAPRLRPVAAAVILALPVYAAVRIAAVRSAPDTMERAAEWLTEHLGPEDDVLLTTKIDLPLFRRRAGMVFAGEATTARRHFFVPWTRYQARLPEGPVSAPRWNLRWTRSDIQRYMRDAAGTLREQGGDYAVVEVYAGRAHPVGTRITEAFRARGELLARISPDGRSDYSEHPIGYQDETTVPNPHFIRRLLQARSTGPVLEIYRLTSD